MRGHARLHEPKDGERYMIFHSLFALLFLVRLILSVPFNFLYDS